MMKYYFLITPLRYNFSFRYFVYNCIVRRLNLLNYAMLFLKSVLSKWKVIESIPKVMLKERK